MPFGGGNRCGRCGNKVDQAEMMQGGGHSYHKSCFNCKDCGKRLDSTTVADNNDDIFCKSCYGRSYGPNGYGYSQGAGSLTK